MQDRVNETVQMSSLAEAEQWVADREREATVP